MNTYGLYGKKKTTKVGRPQNERQRLASKENYALFQLIGAKGNLSNLSIYGTYDMVDGELYYVLKHISQAIRNIKAIQAHRKAKAKP